MLSRSSDLRKLSNRGSRRGSSRRRYSYTNTHTRRRKLSTCHRDNMERESSTRRLMMSSGRFQADFCLVPFRERDERSASPKATRCSSPNLKLRCVQARRCSARSSSPGKNIASPKGGVTPVCAQTPLSSTGRSIADAPKLDLTNRI